MGISANSKTGILEDVSISFRSGLVVHSGIGSGPPAIAGGSRPAYGSKCVWTHPLPQVVLTSFKFGGDPSRAKDISKSDRCFETRLIIVLLTRLALALAIIFRAFGTVGIYRTILISALLPTVPRKVMLI